MQSFFPILLIFTAILYYLVYDYRKSQGTHTEKGYRIAFGSLIIVMALGMAWVNII